jgi:hypothetical protein
MLKLGIFFIVTFISALIITVPLEKLYNLQKSSNDPIILSNIQGTIVSGSASLTLPLAKPAYNADNWQWDLHITDLFFAKLNWRVFQKEQGIDLDIGTKLFAFAKDFNFKLNSDLKSLTDINPIFNLASGKVSGHLEGINLQRCTDASGEISLENLKFMNFKFAKVHTLVTCTKEGAYSFNYASEDNSTQIKGEATIDNRGFYNSSMTASTNDADISAQLAAIASKKLSKDKYLIQTNGYINSN